MEDATASTNPAHPALWEMALIHRALKRNLADAATLVNAIQAGAAEPAEIVQ